MPEVLDAKAELEQLRRLKYLEDKMSGKISVPQKVGRAFEAVGRGLAESPYTQPIEAGYAGDISNVIASIERNLGQVASIPFTGGGQILQGKRETTQVPEVGEAFGELKGVAEEEGWWKAVTKYGLDTVVREAVAIGITIPQPVLQSFLGSLRLPSIEALRRPKVAVEAPTDVAPQPFTKAPAEPVIDYRQFIPEKPAVPLKGLGTEVLPTELPKPIVPAKKIVVGQEALKIKRELGARLELKAQEAAKAKLKPLEQIEGLPVRREVPKGFILQKPSGLTVEQQLGEFVQKPARATPELFGKEGIGKFSATDPPRIGERFVADNDWQILGREPRDVQSAIDFLSAESGVKYREVIDNRLAGESLAEAKKRFYKTAVSKIARQEIERGRNNFQSVQRRLKPLTKWGYETALGTEVTIDPLTGGQIGGTTLYSGIPVDEMAKMLANVSKEGAAAVKFLLEKYDIPEAFRIATERGLIKAPITGGRERGFITSAKEQLPGIATKVQGQYIPRPTDPLAQKARTLIQTDFVLADRIARTGTDEVAVATTSELMKYYNDLAQKAPVEQADVFYAKAGEYANIIAPKLTDLGRAVQAASILGRLTPEGQLKFAAREIQRYNEKITARGWGKKIPELTGEQSKYILQESKRITEMPDGVEKAMAFRKLQNHISDLVPSPLYRKLINVWKAGLLTGIKTTGLNTFSNLFHGASEVIKDIPAAGVERVSSLFTGQKPTIGLTARGPLGGLAEGFQKGWRYLKTGFDERDVGAKLDYRRINYGKSKFAKGVRTYEQSVFRMMGAEDQPFYYGAKARSLQSQAIAQGKNARLKGIELKKFIDNLVENPTDEMVKYAVTDAEIAVFQNQTLLGKAAKAIQRIPGGEFVVPFGRTPAAVAMQLVNYSPVGIAKTIVESIGKGKFDQRLFSQAMGRGITGTAVLFIGERLFEKGLMTLDRPKGEKEQKQWELEGKKPNSIRIGGAWRNPNVLGPAGMILLVGGHYKKGFDETGSVLGGWARATSGGAKSLTEQTFLKGLNSAIDALNDPDRFVPGYLTGMAGSIVPTIIGDIARATDVAERRIESPLQSIKSRIPGLRQTLEPRITVTGEELEMGGSFLETMIDPSRPSKIKSTPLVFEFKRLWDRGYKVTPTLLGDKKGYEALTPEQNTKLWQLTGTTIENALSRMIRTEDYLGFPDETKSKLMDRVIDRVRVRTRAMIAKEIIGNLDRETRRDKLKELIESGMVNRDVLLELSKLKAVNQ